MVALKFASSHNMVAFLDKPTESDGFEQIVDFLNAHPIKYALTVNLTIYTSCIDQFWATVKGKDFFVRDTPLFPSMIVQAQEQVGEGSEIPTDSHHAPTTTQPSTSKTQKKQSRRKQRKDTEVSQPSGYTEPMADETGNVESVPTHSNDPLLSEKTKTSQAAEITELKKIFKKLEGKRKLKPPWMKRLFKIGRSAQVVSFEDGGLGDQEDASKQGRKIADIDDNVEVTLVDETHGRNDEEMFDIGILDGEEVFAKQDVVKKEVSTTEVATDSTTATAVDELTLAQTLIEIKAAKPKAIGVVVQEPSKFITTTSPSQPSQLLQAKDKGKEKMKKKRKLAKQREEDANIAEWDNVQAIIHADYELAARLQAQEQEELIVEEKSKLFVELMDKRKKRFARLRAEEQRRKPPTKAQKRNQICTYLKNMAGCTHKKDEGSVTRAEERSSKRAGIELEQERIKKQKIDDDQEEVEMKKHMEIVVDEEKIVVDAIPLATKPPIIVDWKIIKEGKIEDLETLWKLVKAKHKNTRPDEAYERVLWGDLKVMFEPDIESDV
ncbi:hypothetical protein Tco_1271185 [Tanacetum coccineum]